MLNLEQFKCRALLVAVVFSLSAGSVAQALPLTWNVTGILDDGGQVSGQFTIGVYGYLSSPTSLTSTDGSVLSGVTYSLPPSPSNIIPNSPPAFGVAFYSAIYNRALQITFLNSLEVSSANDPIDLSHSASFECLAWTCPGSGLPNVDANTRFFTSGFASIAGPENGPSQTPLPGALPLFAGGAGVMGLLGWRRKKKGAISA